MLCIFLGLVGGTAVVLGEDVASKLGDLREETGPDSVCLSESKCFLVCLDGDFLS